MCVAVGPTLLGRGCAFPTRPPLFSGSVSWKQSILYLWELRNHKMEGVWVPETPLGVNHFADKENLVGLVCEVEVAVYCLKPLGTWGLFWFWLMSWLMESSMAFPTLFSIAVIYTAAFRPNLLFLVHTSYLPMHTSPSLFGCPYPYLYEFTSACPWLKMEGKGPCSTQLPSATAAAGRTPQSGPQITVSSPPIPLCSSVSAL